MTNFEKKILNILKDGGRISGGDVEKIERGLKAAKSSLEFVLSEDFKLSAEDILSAKSKASGTPAFELADINQINNAVLREISEEAAKQYKIVPLGKENGKLKIGMVNPEDYEAKEAVRFIALGGGAEPEVYVVSEDTFKKILGQYSTLKGQIKEALTELEMELQEPREEKRAVAPRDASEMIREAPITKIVAVVLKHAVEGGASDIHIERGVSETDVRFRVHGKLYTSLLLPLKVHSSVVSRIKILSNLRLDESRIPQDGRFSAKIGGVNIDFRVSTFPTRGGEKVVLRVLDPSKAIGKFEDLGLAGTTKEKVEQAIKQPYGMILISGPTGSGKSTTLYAALKSLDRISYNVVSLEDPVEYYIEGVSQSQIRPEIGYSFASGLRHILRQDPDIIMVGEIRDAETARLATHASLTGHLVFSTIHTKNAIGVVPRLIDMGVDQFIVPSALSLAIAQRLVRKLCPHCKTEFVPPTKIRNMVKEELDLVPEEVLGKFGVDAKAIFKLYKSEGCKKCAMKKTMGRTAVYEVLALTEQLANIIYETTSEVKIKEEAKRQIMVTMRQDGIIKAIQGIISIEEVLRNT